MPRVRNVPRVRNYPIEKFLGFELGWDMYKLCTYVTALTFISLFYISCLCHCWLAVLLSGWIHKETKICTQKQFFCMAILEAINLMWWVIRLLLHTYLYDSLYWISICLGSDITLHRCLMDIPWHPLPSPRPSHLKWGPLKFRLCPKTYIVSAI